MEALLSISDTERRQGVWKKQTNKQQHKDHEPGRGREQKLALAQHDGSVTQMCLLPSLIT